RYEVATVVEALGGRGTGRIDQVHLRGNPRRVEAVAQQVHADRRHDDPQGIDRLLAIQGDATEREAADHREHNTENFIHDEIRPRWFDLREYSLQRTAIACQQLVASTMAAIDNN